MSDTFLRQWAMLQLIPRKPRKVDTATLQKKLTDRGYDINIRTIQRDLDRLSKIFPLVSDERSKPFGWSWSGGEVLDIPGMDPQTALTFSMVDEYLQPLLPRSTLHYLEPHFERARNVLNETDRSTISSWIKKVRVLPRGLNLLAPLVNQEALDGVYEALLSNTRFTGMYQPKNKKVPVEYEVNPLALVVRDRITYLLATLWDYEDILHLPLHRFSSISLLDKPCTMIKSFDLDTIINNGKLGFKVNDKPVRLTLLMDSLSAEHLSETPLSNDQVIEPADDGLVHIKATVMDTLELRWWLRGFGSEVEVLGPKNIRDEFKEIADHLSNAYSDMS